MFDGGCFQDCTNARHVLQNRDSGWQEVAAHDVEVALSRREKNAKMQAGDSTPEESEEAVAFNKHADDCVADEHNSEAEEEAHGALSMRRQDPLGHVGGEKDISGQYAERERGAHAGVSTLGEETRCAHWANAQNNAREEEHLQGK